MKPKIKFFSFLKRKLAMNLDEFSQYWKNVHGPIVVKNLAVPAKFLRYDRNVRIEKTYTVTSELDADGIPEAWFESIEDALRVPSFLTKEQLDDEKNFLQPNAPVLFAEEYLIDYNPKIEPIARGFIFIKSADNQALQVKPLLDSAAQITRDEDRIRVILNTTIDQQKTLIKPMFDAALEIEANSVDILSNSWEKLSKNFLGSVENYIIPNATKTFVSQVTQMPLT